MGVSGYGWVEKGEEAYECETDIDGWVWLGYGVWVWYGWMGGWV